MTKKIKYIVLVTMAGLYVSSYLPARQSMPVLVSSPRQAMRFALQNNPELQESKWAIVTYRSMRQKAQRARYPRIEIMSYVAPVYRIHINKDNWQKYQRDFSQWGPLVSFSGTVMQPLYTFGQLSFAEKAAQWGVRAAQAEKKIKINKIRQKIYEYYWGYQVTFPLEKISQWADQQLKKAIQTAEKKYNSGSGEITLNDLSRLKIFALELEQKKNELYTQRQLAKRALQREMGINHSQTITIQIVRDLRYKKKSLKKLPYYIDLARNNRPELKQADAGIRAHENLAKMHNAKLFPTIGIAGTLDANYSPVRPYLRHPYVYDSYRHIDGGIGIGFTWRFDMFQAGADRDKYQAQANKIRAKKTFAQIGISLQTRKAYLELQNSIKNIQIARQKLRLSRRWAMSAQAGYASGTVAAKDLIEALAAYLQSRIQYYQSHYRAHVHQAQLGMAIGQNIVLIDQSPPKSFNTRQ